MSHRSREWDSTAYQRISAPQFEWGKKVAARVQLRGNETILDAGCGTGRLTAELLRHLPQGYLVAVDLSQNMLRTAREQLEPKFGKRVGFVRVDVSDLPFHCAFDGIFSTATFHWVPDHDRLFRGLCGALKRNGWLEAQCGGGPNLARLRTRIVNLSASPIFQPFLGNYREPWEFSDAETAARRLHKAGFVEIKTWLEAAPTQLEDERQYREFIATAVVHRRLELIPDAKLRERFLDELAQQAADDHPPFELDYWRLNLSTRKPS